jgi:peptidoglycan-associated lipoprotein
MKRFLPVMCLIPIVLTAGCARKVATNRPASIVPVAATPVQPAPEPPQVTVRVTPPAPAASSTPAGITAEESRELSESLARLEDALFDYDQSAIRPDARQTLARESEIIRRILTKYPTEILRLEGHADERGSAEYNLALGDRRAESVRAFLASMGVPAAQMSIISFGKEQPVCSESDETCWQRNRRVHPVAGPNALAEVSRR